MEKPARRGLLVAGVQAAADAGGGLDIAMPHPLLDFLQTEALIQQEAAQRCPCGILPTSRKSPYSKGFRLSGKAFHPFPGRGIGPILWQKMLQERQNTLWAGCQLVPKRTFPLQRRNVLLLCKRIAINRMRHFPAPSGQPKMLRKNVMSSGFCP